MSSKQTILHLVLGELGGGSDYRVDIDWTHSNARVQQLLVTFTDPHSKTSSLLWVTGSPELKSRAALRPPMQLDLAHNSLQLCVYGLEEDRSQQRFLVVSCGATLLSHEENSYFVTLAEHIPGKTRLSLLINDSKKTFPLQVDKTQTEVTDLPRVSSKAGATCLVLCQQTKPFQESLTFRTPKQGRLHNLHLSLPSRRNVKVKVLVIQNVHSSSDLMIYSIQLSSSIKALTTYLSKEDLLTLKTMALNLRKQVKVKEVPLSHFYRNRWTEYFVDIMTKNGGLMEKYTKDNNGDPHSPINGNIQGLFFSAAVDFRTLQPPPLSLFGRWRLHVPAHILFHEATNLYFADFYCHNEAHYITLVMTNAGSEDDRFCQRRLLKLDPYNNEFLYKKNESVVPLDVLLQNMSLDRTDHFWRPETPPTVITTIAKKIHIEVHYTESVNISALMTCYGRHQVHMTSCETLGAGRSRPSGIPKQKGCSICNLPD